MTQDPYLLDAPRRKIVRDAIIEECRFRGWTLHAVPVRSNHVHLVLTSEREPEFVLRACKANGSKRLNQAGFDNSERKRWTARTAAPDTCGMKGRSRRKSTTHCTAKGT